MVTFISQYGKKIFISVSTVIHFDVWISADTVSSHTDAIHIDGIDGSRMTLPR